MNDSILIYKTNDGDVRAEVTLKNESVWLTQIQLSELFGTKRPAITKHLTQIFKNQELCEDSVCSILERTAADGKKYKTKFYNLDAIIAVGYRVNSKKATQFRVWASRVLKDYLIKGYALDEYRLKHQIKRIKDLEKTLSLFQQAQSKMLNQTEATGLLSILTDYTHSFVLLNQYDTGNFQEGGLNTNITIEIDLNHAMEAIGELKRSLM